MKGADLSFRHPNYAQLKELGYGFVGRYIGPGSGTKLLTLEEVQAIHAAGLGIMLLVEGAEDDIFHGAPMGEAHAEAAIAATQLLGAPNFGLVWTFAADRDINSSNIAAVLDYFRGVERQMWVAEIGVYGDEQIIQACHDQGLASFFFHTAATAWDSGMALPSYVDAYQGPNGEAVAGGIIDEIRTAGTPRGVWWPMTGPTPAQELTHVDEEHNVSLAIFNGGSSCGAVVPTSPTSPWQGRPSNALMAKLDAILANQAALGRKLDALAAQGVVAPGTVIPVSGQVVVQPSAGGTTGVQAAK